MQVELLSRDRIFDLQIELVSQCVDTFSLILRSNKCPTWASVKFSFFDAFCSILKIKQMSPLGFGGFQIFPEASSIKSYYR